ncbi:HlyD family secretion protein (plasmid) [Rhizobium grahamii]|uniref:HlyD family secretion protein n=1 Tax=Rhizobium grahamii TaxID=1120045 RepID=A0A5Q0CAQ7_9HYPH|nr:MULTISPECIES: HlyD family secretion protein [Rhizobium]QFY62542.1 HlyD family secretion protein [Rhizobium grahamii]QRM52716.1 HlyD family secretion protein [Rhizobium sp. BG6]
MVELPRKEVFETSAEADRKINDVPPAPAETPTKPTPAAPGQSSKAGLKKGVLALGLLAGAAYGVHFGHDYWTAGRFIEGTDDAYVKADYTTIAPKVGGYIKQVLVNDNDAVKAGQILARIDDRDFQAALNQARADVKAAEAAITNIDAQIELQQSVIDQSKAAVNASNASLVFAKSEAARNARLIVSGAGSQSKAEQTQSLMDQASAAVERDQAALVTAKNKVPVLKTQRDQSVAQRDRAAAAASQAELNLSYTNIVAAVDGTVGARSIRVGQYVTSGTQLMAVVPLHSVYVVANFKETQLTYIKPGQSVEVKVDSFPDLEVKGHVDSISPASGLEFSLLPPDNATGNFTKIVQRIPVKIVIDNDEIAGSLRSGMSVEPEIDTKDEQQSAKR